MKKLVTITTLMIIYFNIQGCATTAAVAGGAAGATFTDPRSIEAQYDDKALSYQALRRINRHAVLRLDSHVSATTYNGVMLLVGQVPSEEARELAEIESQSVRGARQVYNRITIDEPISLKERTEDTWLTTKVKTALLSDTKYNLRNVKVVTENKVVYLLGMVDDAQAKKAAKVASATPGVKKVVKLFEYIKHG